MKHTDKEKRMIIASTLERLAFTEFYKNRSDFQILEMTPVTGSDSYDAVIVSGSSTYLIEIKVRKYPKKAYTGWILEHYKHTFLMEYAKKKGYIPAYMNIHSDGVQIWNLNNVIPEWIDRPLPEDSQTGSSNTKYKKVADLNSADASHYDESYDRLGLQDKAEALYNKHFNKPTEWNF